MDPTAAAVCTVETVEDLQGSVQGAAEVGPEGDRSSQACLQQPWTLAGQQLFTDADRVAERLLRLSGASEISGNVSNLTSRTAVYGPVRTVV